MQLRSHPKMNWRGRSNWPPRWGGTYGIGVILPVGEEGTLKEVELGGNLKSPFHLKLTIEYLGRTFSGLMHFDDPEFAPLLYEKLKHCKGWSVRKVGDLELD